MARDPKKVSQETNGIKIERQFVLRDAYNTGLLEDISTKLDVLLEILIPEKEEIKDKE